MSTHTQCKINKWSKRVLDLTVQTKEFDFYFRVNCMLLKGLCKGMTQSERCLGRMPGYFVKEKLEGRETEDNDSS